jgi:hypothetical protein
MPMAGLVASPLELPLSLAQVAPVRSTPRRIARVTSASLRSVAGFLVGEARWVGFLGRSAITIFGVIRPVGAGHSTAPGLPS